METTAFNLLDEPWIRVMTHDRQIRELSLTQALLQSHEYRRLAGELPTQDVAILRLLLAVLHTVFYRVDLDGADDPIEERGQAPASGRCGRPAACRRGRSAPIWNIGTIGFGCSIRSGRSIRCRART